MATAKSLVEDGIREIEADIAGYEIPIITGFASLPAKLKSIFGRLKFRFGPDPGSSAQFKFWWGQPAIYVTKVPTATDIIHESVHAYNYLIHNLDFEKDDRIDEGMAYLAESYISFHIGTKQVERIVKGAGCPDPCRLAGAWRNVWRNNSTPRWSLVKWQYPSVAEAPMELADHQRFFSNFGVKPNCLAIVNYLNNLLQEKGCCVQLSCEVVDGGGCGPLMGTGLPIEEFFR